jgi:hypothetical protein
MRARLALALGVAVALLAPAPALARDLYESDDGELRLTLRSAFKGSWLLAFPPDDARVDEHIGGAGLFRLRFEANARLTHFFTMQVAYEHRALASSGTGIGVGLLPSTTTPPFRLTALDWAIIDEAPTFTHRHEIDRAYFALHLPFLELTVGRQPIGLGRGVLFSAVDYFSPFSPAEVDREWRRGVDAVHAELRIPELSALSADVIAVFGNVDTGSLASWSVLGRVRAVVGDVDGEVLFGHRGQDDVVGAALSATLGDAEVHGEFSLFGTNGQGIDGGFLGTRSDVAKGLIGGSYNIDLLRGIRVVAEYHYSGFGVENVGRDPHILLDTAFRARLARGDSQILGRHALALSLSTDIVDELSMAVSWLESPVDGSGMVTAGFTYVASDALTLVLTGAFPWGTSPLAGIPRSEWGSSSASSRSSAATTREFSRPHRRAVACALLARPPAPASATVRLAWRRTPTRIASSKGPASGSGATCSATRSRAVGWAPCTSRSSRAPAGSRSGWPSSGSTRTSPRTCAS